jgi:hypothetical protein
MPRIIEGKFLLDFSRVKVWLMLVRFVFRSCHLAWLLTMVLVYRGWAGKIIAIAVKIRHARVKLERKI